NETFVLCEDQFLCSICLDVFTEPVSTPCGHNYCKACITGYWDTHPLTQCPLCKETFHRRPELRVNTGFREIVEHFKKMSLSGRDESPAKPGEVPCDVCLEGKQKALKTCLVCLASYCQLHLEPHQRATALKRHKLIDPVPNLDQRVCKKHDKIFELFCTEDQTCLCIMCMKDNHTLHETIPLEEEFRNRKAWLEAVMSEIKQMEKDKTKSIQEIKCSITQRRNNAKKDLEDIAEVFHTLVASLQRNQAELVRVIEEKNRDAEKQAKDVITELEQEVTDLERRRTELEQLSHSEDHLHLLQYLPSPCDPPYTKDLFHSLGGIPPPCDAPHTEVPPDMVWSLLSLPSPLHTIDYSDISCQINPCVETVRKAVTELKETLCNKMEKLITEVQISDGYKAIKETATAKKQMTTFCEETENLPQDKLMTIQQLDEVDVTLDPDTAYPKLIVSQDEREVRFSQNYQLTVPHSQKRIEYQPYILGKEGFSSGRFYYEVQLNGCTFWFLGVARESINRKNYFFCPIPEEGGWTVCGRFNEFEEVYFVNTSPPCPLYLRQRPQRVGVFVDYEEGEVSFYDVDARTLIYSFTGCNFSESVPPLKALFYSLTGSSLNSRPKLYPIFGVFDFDGNPIKITPVGHTPL
uniref:Uncharacterized protein n=1 Tax=Myripristis murdjan TaxID=586833 RepID=A0A667WR96_9TELE